jgi:hypothetical protein
MSIQYLKNALAIGSAKEAALYFDTVVPLDLLAGPSLTGCHPFRK